MKIPVERLSDTPTVLEFEADSGWWRACMPPAPDLPPELDEPLGVRLEAHRLAGDELHLVGRLTGSLGLECGRCLKRYRHALSEPFRLVLEPAGNRAPTDPAEAESLARNGLCLGEDIATGWYRGPEIVLGAFLHEVVTLALPVKPLCREDCPGLCPRCGADRQLGPCGCSEIEMDSPFAALRALREELTRGED